jgi:hypothetical protein
MKKLFESWKTFIKEEKESQYLDEVSFNSMSAMSVFADKSVNEAEGNFEYEFSLAGDPNPEIVKRFSESLYSGKRSGFLSPYSDQELSAMSLYLIKGQNAGFAIKDGDDIVSVHNNSSLKGLGNEFMRKAKEVGGSKLDHFDGFLSGLYRKHGFTDVYEIYQWDEQYKPAGWNYDPVDISNKETSVYAKTIQDKFNVDRDMKVQAEDKFEIEINPVNKVQQYRYGRPDVILRRL